ncbi:MAG: peptide chain release factor N(5)-glutamine methyltransferase [Maribacter sp.]|uniref:peptide chain release factor N(5)-glutamine methyltransferase n=1 Tax=Maribacter sp. TaxID=1897614 RepID=UPI0032992494
MLLREIKNVFHAELDPLYDKEEVDSFFYLLIEYFLGLDRFVLAIQPHLIISKENEEPMFEALSRLKLNEPVQHIIGKTHFMDMEFVVNKNVLIPRPETEELVRWIVGEVAGQAFQAKSGPLKILDIGTGSGCIAISLAKHIPEAEVFALDVSEEALQVAKENAMVNKVEIELVNSDVLELESLDIHFDIIVSNPPYVRELEKNEMQKNVLEHEPHLALFVTNENPLLFYERITGFALKNLKIGGRLFFEINQYLGKETERLLRDHNFSEIEVRKDMFGNDRMLRGIKVHKTTAL